MSGCSRPAKRRKATYDNVKCIEVEVHKDKKYNRCKIEFFEDGQGRCTVNLTCWKSKNMMLNKGDRYKQLTVEHKGKYTNLLDIPDQEEKEQCFVHSTVHKTFTTKQLEFLRTTCPLTKGLDVNKMIPLLMQAREDDAKRTKMYASGWKKGKIQKILATDFGVLALQTSLHFLTSSEVQTIEKALRKSGTSAYADCTNISDIVQKTPFKLIRRGLSYQLCDKIAYHSKVDTATRAKHALEHAIRTLEKDHVWFEKWELRRKLIKMNIYDGNSKTRMEVLTLALKKVDEVNELKQTSVHDINFFDLRMKYEAEYLTTEKMYKMELAVSNMIHQMKVGSMNDDDWKDDDYDDYKYDDYDDDENDDDYDDENTTVEIKKNIIVKQADLDDDQKKAVDIFNENSVMCLTGGAGNGKTHALAEMKRHLVGEGFSVMTLAPTGSAADNAKKKLRDAGLTDDDLKNTVHTIHKFVCSSSIVPPDVIFVDEASMMDMPILHRLLKQIKNKTKKLVFVGDHHQLPSVGIGTCFHDLVKSKSVAVAELTQQHRQSGSGGAYIAQAANRIWGPETYNKPEEFKDMHKETLFEVATAGSKEDVLKYVDRTYNERKHRVQVLTQVNDDLVWYGKEIQKIFNRDGVAVGPTQYTSDGDWWTFKVNDRVIYNGSNEYIDVPVYKAAASDLTTQELYLARGQMLKVVGGNKTTVLAKDDHGKEYTFTYNLEDHSDRDDPWINLRHLQLSYAITIHKSQGREYEHVAIRLDNRIGYCTKECLYTGITRAKSTCKVFAGDGQLHASLMNSAVEKRKTKLKEHLEANSK